MAALPPSERPLKGRLSIRAASERAVSSRNFIRRERARSGSVWTGGGNHKGATALACVLTHQRRSSPEITLRFGGTA
ncbi:hypothetical protein B1812_06550 [Methylocystis bryophila]|uniref:Uncharacterized protein n=1 Tax=Methylocystis bryophila TaxID=655015 RepID=A0A1W6MT57_9HYPH|nr:hypothetical protein B1812_06550 [Methylocystis bryophila]